MKTHVKLLFREEQRELLPLCADQGIGVLPSGCWLARAWSDEADTDRAKSDALATRFMRGPDHGVVDAVGEVATLIGPGRSQVALAWLLAKPWVTARIIGVSLRLKKPCRNVGAANRDRQPAATAAKIADG